MGARLVYANNVAQNIKQGDKIYITDGKGNYMNASLKFTATKVEWNFAADGKLLTTSDNSTVLTWTMYIHTVIIQRFIYATKSQAFCYGRPIL